MTTPLRDSGEASADTAGLSGAHEDATILPFVPREHGSALATVAPSRKARVMQLLHASAIQVLPALAVPLAAWMALRGDVHPWHVLTLLVMYVITILGIGVGYHRYLTHRSFQAGNGVKAALTIAACMAAQGPPLYWVGNHRRHHRYVDRDGDPHSPNWGRNRELGAWEGFWHAHVGWTLKHDLSNAMEHCPDLLRDPTVRWVARHYFAWIVLGLLLPALAGLAVTQTWAGFFQGLLWGGFLRLFFSYHMINGINSLGHNRRWGYRRFDSSDSSRNIWFFGVFSLGEGWHNNHHADGSAAIFSRAWHELDVGGLFIVLLEKLGLARHVRRPRDTKDAA